ncbi:MAG: hypothetical protein J6F30_06200 [Cellulosilyticum sp.]|nr:hypothetical protein [Cellulosilyticum sp.]
MARVRKVTRTIISTDVEVMTANTVTQEFGSVVVTIAGTYNMEDEKDAKALEKATRKSFANLGLDEGVVMVSIQNTTPVTKHYTMLEDDFIKLAECKVLAQGESVDDDEE